MSRHQLVRVKNDTNTDPSATELGHTTFQTTKIVKDFTKDGNDWSNIFKFQNETKNDDRLSKLLPLSNLSKQDHAESKTRGDSNLTSRSEHQISSARGNSTEIGHYLLKKTLGKGNFSTVKLAQHQITHHLVAIKIVKTSILSEDNLIKIHREIDVLKRLGKHENIVRLYQVIKTKRYFMLVSEYCTNGELFDYIVEKGRLTEPQSCKYFVQILSAVEFLHENNIVHRDIKAENLLLTNDLETIKLADFGFSNYFKQDEFLSTWCGSPPYAAPELFKGVKYVGPPVDIWSMGVILYVLVCGSLPFDGRNLFELKSRVLKGKFRIPFFMAYECENLIRGMLRLEPEKRLSIKQIRSHVWTTRNGNTKKENLIASNNSSQQSTKAKFSDGAIAANPSSAENLDKTNNNTRGQSLDLEDDKKQSAPSNEDASMVCLAEDNTETSNSTARLSHKGPIRESPKMPILIDQDIVNAVSNMSLDSSASQAMDTLSKASSQASTYASTKLKSNHMDTESISIGRSQTFKKESSLDDQIIDYMVEELKVSESSSPIRNSIAHERYDDFHAIYKLLRDQPDKMFEVQRIREFKKPSSSTLISSKDRFSNRPSITTGFLSKIDDCRNESSTKTEIGPDRRITGPASATSDEGAGQQCQLPSWLDNKLLLDAVAAQAEMKKNDEKLWHGPPQLFLTPPRESQSKQTSTQTGNEHITSSTDSPKTDSHEDSRNLKYEAIRHSFDSNMLKLDETTCVPGFFNNKLALTNSAKHCLWDSSILDTIGLSTPPPMCDSSNTSPINTQGQVAISTIGGDNDPNLGAKLSHNYSRITTNLPTIGLQHDQTTSASPQNLLQTQLGALASSETQSSMFMQGTSMGCYRLQVEGPAQFTPNNLINQNNTMINQWMAQTNSCAPGTSLLDPNSGSGYERRASDGQASYNSLTTNCENQVTANRSRVHHNIANSTSSSCNQRNIDALQEAAISISSQQLNSSPNFRSLVCNQAPNSPSVDDQSNQSPCNRMMINSNSAIQEQTRPLDLTKRCEGSNYKDFETDIINFSNYLRKDLDPNSRFPKPSNLPNSATTSPRNSIQVTNNSGSYIPSRRASPSSLSLTSRGSVLLPSRRKRHSIESETSGHFCCHHHHRNSATLQQNCLYSDFGRNLNYGPCCQLQQFHIQTQCSLKSHPSQLRSFSRKKSVKQQETNNIGPNWDPPDQPPKSPSGNA